MTTWSTWAATKAHVVDLLAAVPDLAPYVLEGAPGMEEADLVGPTGDGVVVWVDNGNVEVTVEPRSLGVGKIAETYRLVIAARVIARDSDTGIRAAEHRVVELVSAVMDVVYGSLTGYELAVGLPGWTTRAQFDGLTFDTPLMEHGGYSALGLVGMQINGTRC